MSHHPRKRWRSIPSWIHGSHSRHSNDRTRVQTLSLSLPTSERLRPLAWSALAVASCLALFWASRQDRSNLHALWYSFLQSCTRLNFFAHGFWAFTKSASNWRVSLKPGGMACLWNDSFCQFLTWAWTSSSSFVRISMCTSEIRSASRQKLDHEACVVPYSRPLRRNLDHSFDQRRDWGEKIRCVLWLATHSHTMAVFVV